MVLTPCCLVFPHLPTAGSDHSTACPTLPLTNRSHAWFAVLRSARRKHFHRYDGSKSRTSPAPALISHCRQSIRTRFGRAANPQSHGAASHRPLPESDRIPKKARQSSSQFLPLYLKFPNDWLLQALIRCFRRDVPSPLRPQQRTALISGRMEYESSHPAQLVNRVHDLQNLLAVLLLFPHHF